MALEHFVLQDQHERQIGLIPILQDDYDMAFAKAKAKAKAKVNPVTDVTIYHRKQDKWSETLNPVLKVSDN